MTSFNKKLLWLIVTAVLVRAGFALVYPVRSFPDTAGYFQTGKQFVSGDYTSYRGNRPPVYPLIIAGCGFNRGAIVCLQAAMGVGISVLLFLIFSRLTRSDTTGLLLGLTYALNPSQLLFEFALLSETTCTMLLTLSLYMFIRMTARGQQGPPPGRDLLVLGLVCSLCFLTRRQFQLLPLMYALFLVYHFRGGLRQSVGKAVVLLIPAVVIAAGYSAFQYKRVGRFTLTTGAGYQVMTNVLNYIEYAPERFGKIKQTLIYHRSEKCRVSPESFGAVDMSREQILRETDLSYAELSEQFTVAALATIREKPLIYLKYVSKALVRFFKPTWYAGRFGIRAVMQGDSTVSKAIAFPYALFHVAAMALFLVYPMLWIIFPGIRDRELLRLETVFIYCLVLSTAFIQALVQYSENPRFKTSVEPLIICMAVWIAIKFFARRRKSPEGR